MWWGHHGFFPFGFFFLVLILFVIFRIVCSRRYWHYGGYGGHGSYYGHHGYTRHHDHNEAEVIIRKRLASGEIDEVEYQRLLNILNK